METLFDWVTVMLFAGLVTHFLAQSVKPDGDDIGFGHYLLLTVGCATANWLGNHGWALLAVTILLAGAAYAYRFLRVARRPPRH